METKAKESGAVKRLRNRLKKHLTEQESKTTPEALTHMSKVIKDLLQRKIKARSTLKERVVVVFDQNQHPAKDAKATIRLREMVKKDYFPPQNGS